MPKAQGTIPRVCNVCDATFYVYPYRSTARFCSVPCANAAAQGRKLPPVTAEHAAKISAAKTAYYAIRRKPRPTCTDCGVAITKGAVRCNPCAHIFRSANLTPGMRASLSANSREMWNNQELRLRMTEENRRTHQSPEYRAKVSGENASNWRGGRKEFNAKRIQNRRWKNFRREYVANHPNICEVCSVPAKILHHRIPVIVWPEGEFLESNIQVVCQPCHVRLEHILHLSQSSQ